MDNYNHFLIVNPFCEIPIEKRNSTDIAMHKSKRQSVRFVVSRGQWKIGVAQHAEQQSFNITNISQGGLAITAHEDTHQFFVSGRIIENVIVSGPHKTFPPLCCIVKRVTFNMKRSDIQIVMTPVKTEDRATLYHIYHEAFADQNIDIVALPAWQSVPYGDDITDEGRQRRLNFLRIQTSRSIQGLDLCKTQSSQAFAQVGHLIGGLETPIGVVGPLHLKGQRVLESVYLPVAPQAQTKLSILESVCKAITAEQGIHTSVTSKYLPYFYTFEFESQDRSFEFLHWLEVNKDEVVQPLLDIVGITSCNFQHQILGTKILLLLQIKINDASTSIFYLHHAWQLLRSMVVKANQFGENFIRSCKIESDPLLFQLPRGLNCMSGIQAYSSCFLSEKRLRSAFDCSSTDLMLAYQAMVVGTHSHQHLYEWLLSQVAMATGQCLATDSLQSSFYLEERDQGIFASFLSPYWNINTNDSRQLGDSRHTLNMMDCFGSGKESRLGEILVGFSLAAHIASLVDHITNERLVLFNHFATTQRNINLKNLCHQLQEVDNQINSISWNHSSAENSQIFSQAKLNINYKNRSQIFKFYLQPDNDQQFINFITKLRCFDPKTASLLFHPKNIIYYHSELRHWDSFLQQKNQDIFPHHHLLKYNGTDQILLIEEDAKAAPMGIAQKLTLWTLLMNKLNQSQFPSIFKFQPKLCLEDTAFWLNLIYCTRKLFAEWKPDQLFLKQLSYLQNFKAWLIPWQQLDKIPSLADTSAVAMGNENLRVTRYHLLSFLPPQCEFIEILVHEPNLFQHNLDTLSCQFYDDLVKRQLFSGNDKDWHYGLQLSIRLYCICLFPIKLIQNYFDYSNHFELYLQNLQSIIAWLEV